MSNTAAKQPTFILILLSLLIFLGTSLITNETYTVETNRGIFSHMIQAQPEIGDFPSQYFLCGISFKQSNWQATLWNCNCGMRWYRWKRQYRCNYCVNDFYTQVSAIKATFCSYSDWQMQIQKVFETGTTKGRYWRPQIKCPKGQYVSRASGRLGSQHGVNLGYVGTQFKCENIDFTQSSLIQDGYSYSLFELSKNRQGNMVSGFEVKYIKGQIVSGIRWNFQSMPRISKIQVKYENLQKLDPNSVIIENAEVVNNGSTIAQRSVAFTKSYEIKNRWTNSLSFTSGYTISQGVSISPMSWVEQSVEYSTYQSKTENFTFNRDIKTTYSSTQQLLVLVPSGRTVKVSSLIQQKNVSVPYQATLYFEDRFTRNAIGVRTVKGIWQGVMASSIKTVISQTSNLSKDANTISLNVPSVSN